MILKCDHSSRHFRINDKNVKTATFPSSNVYIDIMDTLHYYIFHLIATGLRCIKQEDIDNNDNHQENGGLYDAEFARKIKLISQTRETSKRFKRLSTNCSDKFNIKPNDQYDDIDGNAATDYKQNITYLDTVF